MVQYFHVLGGVDGAVSGRVIKVARILVIDDDPCLRQILRRHLDRLGHEAVTAENGLTGMKMFENDSFDLVITDIIMPEQEGLETISQLKGKDAQAGIVVMSGGGSIEADDYLKLALALGADAALAKPFNLSELDRTVNEVLPSRPREA